MGEMIKSCVVKCIMNAKMEHLPEVQAIAEGEEWDFPLDDLVNVYSDYGDSMHVALNEQGQVLGVVFLCVYLFKLFICILNYWVIIMQQ